MAPKGPSPKYRTILIGRRIDLPVRGCVCCSWVVWCVCLFLFGGVCVVLGGDVVCVRVLFLGSVVCVCVSWEGVVCILLEEAWCVCSWGRACVWVCVILGRRGVCVILGERGVCVVLGGAWCVCHSWVSVVCVVLGWRGVCHS